jgi:hypothetical protein
MGLFLKFRNWFAVQNRIARADKLLFAATEPDKPDNIEQAIAIYEEALAIANQYRYRFAPEEILFNLGIAYAVRTGGEPNENQVKAFKSLRQAIGGENFQDMSIKYACNFQPPDSLQSRDDFCRRTQ